MPTKPLPFRRVLWPLLVFSLVLIPHIGLKNYVYDDAYIQIRIASHLVQYGQPYFNPGEAVNASSSPVWTILVGAVLLISRFHLIGIAVFNAAITTIGVFAFLVLLSSETPLTLSERIIFGAAYLAITLPSSIGWMETSLAWLVGSLALLRYLQDRPDAFILFGLAPFIRMEFALLSLIIFCHAIIRRKMPLARVTAYSLAGAVPFLLYEFYFFRALVPNSIIAKSVVYSLSHHDVFLAIVVSLFRDMVPWTSMYRFLGIIPFMMIFSAVSPLAVYLLNPRSQLPSFLFLALILFGESVTAAYILKGSG